MFVEIFYTAKILPEISRYNLEEYFFLIIFKSSSELFYEKVMPHENYI